jgi:hypothetical protein
MELRPTDAATLLGVIDDEGARPDIRLREARTPFVLVTGMNCSIVNTWAYIADNGALSSQQLQRGVGVRHAHIGSTQKP